MEGRHTARADKAHHHPHVHQVDAGAWRWQCDCGGASCRTVSGRLSWRQAVIAALNHATCLA